MKAKNASFSSASASPSTGKLLAADTRLEDSGFLLWSLWVFGLEPKMLSVGQKGTERSRVGMGSAPDLPPGPSPALGKIITCGHVYTGPCLHIPPVDSGGLLKVGTAFTVQMATRGPEKPEDLLEVTQQLWSGEHIFHSPRIFTEHLLCAGDKIGQNPCPSRTDIGLGAEKDTLFFFK